MIFNPPQSPLVRGEANRADVASNARNTPSPDKGRVGEGFRAPEELGQAFIPYNNQLTELARENRKNPTPAENRIWNQVLRKKQFAQYKFTRQKPIGNFIADFYCSELRLVIEIDGESHAAQVQYDTERTLFLNAQMLDVVRYSNHDVLNNIDGVYQHLLAIVLEKSSANPI